MLPIQLDRNAVLKGVPALEQSTCLAAGPVPRDGPQLFMTVTWAVDSGCLDPIKFDHNNLQDHCVRSIQYAAIEAQGLITGFDSWP